MFVIQTEKQNIQIETEKDNQEKKKLAEKE